MKRRKKMLYHFLVLSHLLSLPLLPHSLHLLPLLLLQEILRITGSLHMCEHQQQTFDQLGEAKMVRSYNLYWADSGSSHGTNQGPRAGWSWSNEDLSSFLLLRLYFFLFAYGCCPRGHTLTHAVKCFFIKF